MEEKVLDWETFTQVDMRVGTIEEVQEFPEARNPAYKLKINFGEEIGIRWSSAQITLRYAPEDLLGKQIVAVVNFPPKRIAGFKSQCLVLGAVEGKDVVVLQTSTPVKNGLPIS